MKFTDFIKRFIRNYFIIFSIIVIFLTVLRQILLPNTYITISDMYTYMICALAADLSSIILYSPKVIPEREMRIRIILQFIVLEAILLVLANAMGWINGIENTISLAIEIAMIYGILRVALLVNDKKSAQSINEKLKAMKDEPLDETEEE